ncbi:hypothetical protein EMIT0158MI4_60275 [Burkholderia ambifaria]
MPGTPAQFQIPIPSMELHHNINQWIYKNTPEY